MRTQARHARRHERAQSSRLHTHIIEKRRRHYAATDDWRRRVANVDHHKRVGPLRRHVRVRAAHGDAISLCAQNVRVRARARAHEGPGSWASKLEGMEVQLGAGGARAARTPLNRDAEVTLPTIDPEPTMVVECASCRP